MKTEIKIQLIKQEPDLNYSVKIQYNNQSIWGYGETLEKAKIDAKENVEGLYQKKIKLIY